MDDAMKEYNKIPNLIPKDEFIEKYFKLHDLIGLTKLNRSRLNNSPEGFIWLHDKNDFPLKGFMSGFGYISNSNVAKILSESIRQQINLFEDDLNYCIILDFENYFGRPIKFISKDKMFSDEILEKFQQDLISYTLGYYEEYSLLKSFKKGFHDFNSIEGFLNYLSNFSDEHPSIKWALNEYYEYKDDYTTVNDVTILIEKVDDLYHRIFDGEIGPKQATEIMDDLMSDYHKIHVNYDFWDQYGVDFEW